jgi:hypothetical protein
MDVFEFQQPYRVLICNECQYCVRLSISALTTYLRAQHKSHLDVHPRNGAKGADSAEYVAQQLYYTGPLYILAKKSIESRQL